jgi:hypothetical protein
MRNIQNGLIVMVSNEDHVGEHNLSQAHYDEF